MTNDTTRAFQLPASLLSEGFALRPETEDDVPFLLRLYSTTREEELASVSGWTAEEKVKFLEMQFQAQRKHYREQIANCRT